MIGQDKAWIRIEFDARLERAHSSCDERRTCSTRSVRLKGYMASRPTRDNMRETIETLNEKRLLTIYSIRLARICCQWHLTARAWVTAVRKAKDDDDMQLAQTEPTTFRILPSLNSKNLKQPKQVYEKEWFVGSMMSIQSRSTCTSRNFFSDIFTIVVTWLIT